MPRVRNEASFLNLLTGFDSLTWHMTTQHISFAHLISDSGDHYYLALPGYFNTSSEYDVEYIKETAESLTGESADCLYIVALDSVSLGLNEPTLL